MTRVSRRPASVLARRSPGSVAKRKTRKHKVILESVTREKKRLRSVISFEAKAPPGYTFISAGDPHLTTACKEFCRRAGLKVYAVSTTPHMHTHGLSQHVHRIGYHFPSAVVATVCMDRGLYLTATGKAVPFYSMGNETGHKHTDSDSQITINTEARDVLKDLFPNIPDNDLNQIIKTAFQKGQRKVGTAVELPLARRAQLAVVAHIRHIYTNYDRLLKTTSFHEARATVEHPTLAKLVEWRGDDENGKTVLEDVFREVIVISDDEDSDIEGEPHPIHGRDTSVEVISSKPVIEELQMHPNYGNPILREAPVDFSEDETAPGFRFIPEVPRKTKIDRRGFSRYQAWDRAINRYKNLASGSSRQPSGSTRESLPESHGPNREPHLRRPIDPHHPSVFPSALPNREAVNVSSSRPPLQPVAEHRVSSTSSLCPKSLQGVSSARNTAVLTLGEPYDPYTTEEVPKKNGSCFNPPDSSHPITPARAPSPEAGRPFQQAEFPFESAFVNGPLEMLETHRNNIRPLPRSSEHLQHRNVTQQDRVLPSIESPLPADIKRPNSGHIEHLTKRMSGAFTFRSVTPHRQNHLDCPNHTALQEPAQNQGFKRRRIAYHEPTPKERPPTSPHSHTTVIAGSPYAIIGHSSVQTGTHVRRHVAPIEPRRIQEAQPSTAQESDTTRFGREPHIPVHRGPDKAYKSRPFSPTRLLDTQVAHQRSHSQPHMAPTSRYAFFAANGANRTRQFYPADERGSHISHGVQVLNSKEMRPRAVGHMFEPSLRRNHPAEHKPTEKRRLYADGFVRPVDAWEHGIPEYRSIYRLPFSRIAESPPQPHNVKYHATHHRHDPSDNLIAGSLQCQLRPDTQSTTPPQQHPTIGGQNLRQQAERPFKTPIPVYQHERQPRNPPSFSRYGHKENPILIDT
ncbi:hypothetical protein BJX70DRAFT_391711 [Aspergillus crustosus]